MSRSTRHQVALGPLRVELTLRASSEVTARLADRLRWAAPATGEPDVRVALAATAPLFYRNDDRVVVSPDAARVERHDFRLRRAESPLTTPSWTAETHATAESAELALRWIAGRELLTAGGLLVHGSSVVRRGRGHAFLGASGAGKTTIARACEAETILCDEVSLIARLAATGCWGVYPSPFWGMGTGREARGRDRPLVPGFPGSHVAVPLAAVWLLEGRDSTASIPVPPADAALAVYRRTIDLGPVPSAPDLALDAIASLVAKVPITRLSWRLGDRLDAILDSPPRTRVGAAS